ELELEDVEEVQRSQPTRFHPVGSPSKKLKERVEAAPINWMKGELPFTIRDALSGSNANLRITLPQLLDCSPRLRRDLAELLRSSVPRSRRKKNSQKVQTPEQMTLHTSQIRTGSKVISEASPGAEDDVECLYIEAWVGKVKV